MTTKSKYCLDCGEPVPDKIVEFGRQTFANVPADVSRCFVHWVDLNLAAKKKHADAKTNSENFETNLSALSAWKRSNIISRLTQNWADASDELDELDDSGQAREVDDELNEQQLEHEQEREWELANTRVLKALD